MAKAPLEAEREQLIKQLEADGLYDALMYLHENKHLGDNCFCTTEVHGAYNKVLEIFFAHLEDAKRETRDRLSQLNWLQILSDAIRSRPTSWRENPVFEYRNASDEIHWAVMRAGYTAGIFTDPWKDAAEAVKENLDPPTQTPKGDKEEDE